MKVLVAASLATVGLAQSLNEFTNGGCKSAIMIFARGSVEPGNVGMIIGPPLFTPLKKLVPDIAIEGVPYGAGLLTNLGKGGADPKGVDAATKLFTDAHSKCPKAAIIGGGYSQGAAVMHRSVEKLPQDVKNHIAGIVLYGDTQNKQDGGQIKNFPKEKVKIFCNANDGVCGGGLNVNGGHFAYTNDFQPGADFLAERIKQWQSGKGISSSDSSSEDSAPAAAPKSPKAAPKGAPKGAAPKGGAPKGGAPKAPSPKSPKSPEAKPAPKTPKPAPKAPEEPAPAEEPAAAPDAPAADAPAAPAEEAPMPEMGGHSHGRRRVYMTM